MFFKDKNIIFLDDHAPFVLIFENALKAVVDWAARRIGKVFDFFGFYAVLRNVARYTPANKENRIISKFIENVIKNLVSAAVIILKYKRPV